MRVRVDLFGELRNRLKRGQDYLELDIADGMTVGELVDSLGIRGEFYGASIDGKLAAETEGLRDGSAVAFFAPMHGGQ